jgi:deoxyribodipyrimidine photo-lyase
MRSPRSIAWLRRDLRFSDNRVLLAATDHAERAWPVFVVDPAMRERHAAAHGRVAWFAANLRALNEKLSEHGAGIGVLVGAPQQVLPRFAREVGADVVFAAADEDPVAVERDRLVAQAVNLRLVSDTRLLPPAELRTQAGDPYSIYSPFRRALDARLAEDEAVLTGRADAEVARLAPRPDGVAGPEAFDAPPAPHDLPEPGEDAATSRLRAFLRSDLPAYADERNAPGRDATSHISPYLRVGAISVRAAWRAAVNAESRARERRDRSLAKGAASWRRELAWREFHAHVLATQPRVVDESFRPSLDSLAWAEGPGADEGLQAWRDGQTGYPMVDAGMRQMRATGWMHNRARLTTASFLVKDLGIDWRQGESVFMEHLLDGDLSQNNGNWQWVAGVGTDAAPYFRILNPMLQAKRFDPAGEYVRRWVPELADVADKHVLEPWTASDPPQDYPGPIVDHAAARQRALDRYGALVGEGSR